MKNNSIENEIEEIKKLLPKVLDKLFPVPVERLAWSIGMWFGPNETEKEIGDIDVRCWDLDLVSQVAPVTEQDLIDHFSQKPISERHIKDDAARWAAELFIELKERETNHIKSFCLRIGGAEDMREIRTKLLSKLDYYDIEYLIHHLVDESRIWIFCDTSVCLAELFIRKFLDEAAIRWFVGPIITPSKDQEAAPIPGGYSFDSGGLVEFWHKVEGFPPYEIGDDPIFIMKSILECKPVSEMKMLDVLRQPVGRKR